MLFASLLFVKLVPMDLRASEKTSGESYSNHPNFISISVIIDKDKDFDDLWSWLESVNYTKFTFVICADENEGYILDNSTRINILKQYGKLIPRLPYYQQYSPSNRERKINDTLDNYRAKVGYVPKGIMDFVPDTYSANYAMLKGVEYIQGYCFDQYAIDYVTERGGFQMPYYASPTHILVPSITSGGIVVLPHSTWDWVASFTVDHNLQTHVDNLMTIFHNNRTLAKNYFLSFIDNTFSGSQPFGFVNFQFEWSWTRDYNNTDVAKEWITTLMTEYSQFLVTYEEFVEWFKLNYPATPEYKIKFNSPYDNSNIEWYFSNESRVARIGDYVVSYVDYTKQLPDKYLNQIATINWLGNASDPKNCVDVSLTFNVDALGRGRLRHPPSSFPISYVGDLRNFSKYYVTLALIQLETAYQSLSLNYSELKSNSAALNLTFHSLLGNFTALQAKYDSFNLMINNMQGQIDSLNLTFHSLLGNFTALQAKYDSFNLMINNMQGQIDSLNLTFHSLLGNFTALQAKYDSFNLMINNMQGQIDSLNLTCKSLQKSISNLTMTFGPVGNILQGQVNSLNDTCGKLTQSITNLQAQLDSMNSTLQASINGLQDQYNSQRNQTNTIIDVLYALTALTVVLVATTIYLAIRKPRKET